MTGLNTMSLAAPPKPPETDPRAPGGRAGHLAAPRRHILCIEDNRETAALIGEALDAAGFRLTLAFSGLGGIEALQREKPDLIICDISMPGLSGFDVLDRVIGLGQAFAAMPFIFLTAHADRETELKGRRLGADEFLTKPVDFELMAAVIANRLASGAGRNAPHSDRLNERERAVLKLAASGSSSAEIAEALRMTKRTVDFHADNARRKLRAATRIEAVAKAAKNRLIDV